MTSDSIGTWIGTILSGFGALYALYQGWKSKTTKEEILEIETRINREVGKAEERLKSRVEEIYNAEQISNITIETERILKTINKFTCEKRKVQGERHSKIIEDLGQYLVKLKSNSSVFERNLEIYNAACSDIEDAINNLNGTNDPKTFCEKSATLQAVISSLLPEIRKKHKSTATLGDK